MTRGRVLRWAFVAAACLSFLVNAAVLGIALRAYQSGVFPFAAAGDLVMEVSAQDRRAFVAALQADDARISALQAVVRDRRTAMFRAAAAPTPDPEAVRAAMAEARAATEALQRALQDIFLEAVVLKRAGQD